MRWRRWARLCAESRTAIERGRQVQSLVRVQRRSWRQPGQWTQRRKERRGQSPGGKRVGGKLLSAERRGEKNANEAAERAGARSERARETEQRHAAIQKAQSRAEVDAERERERGESDEE